MPKYRHIQPPPELFLREFLEGEEGIDGTGIKEYNDLIRYRLGILKDWLETLYIGIGSDAAQECCTCFRWVWTTRATTDGQTDFYPPLPDMTLENTPYQIVYARSSHLYWGDAIPRDYTVDVVNNSITLAVGIPEGALLTIYALRHNCIQEVFYETVAVPLAPNYLFSPPVTVDRAPGRQLVFARTSPRFLDSGRLGDQYTVSNTLNTISLSAGLGPVDAWACIYRLMECGVLSHGEVLATVDGQTVFSPETLDNDIKPHDVGKMKVFARTSFLHPGAEYICDVMSNTITINAPGLNVDDPLNFWVFR